MKEFIGQLNKAFESRVRLGIMTVLVVNEQVDFVTLKEILDVSDGNLASHLTALEKAEYLKVEKKFICKKPNTTYQVTHQGRITFTEHLLTLEKLINNSSPFFVYKL